MTIGYTVMSEYIAGFDAGFEYVLNEIEKWKKQNPKGTVEQLYAYLSLKPENDPSLLLIRND